jgi:hypothetical protein
MDEKEPSQPHSEQPWLCRTIVFWYDGQTGGYLTRRTSQLRLG